MPKMPRRGVPACTESALIAKRKLSFNEECLAAADNTPVLQIDLLPSAKHHRLVLSHNSALAHNEKGVEFSREMAGVERVLCSEWPGNSVDLNIIENRNLQLKAKLGEKTYNSISELQGQGRKMWASIPQNCFRATSDSMPARFVVVKKAHSGNAYSQNDPPGVEHITISLSPLPLCVGLSGCLRRARA